jgi:hypothetical protein
MTLFEA